VLRALLLVAARAERLVAGAGEHDRADLLVGPGALEARDQLVDRPRPEGVVALGPVDRDPGDAALDFEQHIFIGGLAHDDRLTTAATSLQPEPSMTGRRSELMGG